MRNNIIQQRLKKSLLFFKEKESTSDDADSSCLWCTKKRYSSGFYLEFNSHYSKSTIYKMPPIKINSTANNDAVVALYVTIQPQTDFAKAFALFKSSSLGLPLCMGPNEPRQ